MSDFYIAIKDNKADVVTFKLSRGVKPYLPKYSFIGPYDTKKKAEDSIPLGCTYKGQMVGLDGSVEKVIGG